MTKGMDRIWQDAEKDIDYHEQATDHFRFQSAYHGSGRYTLSAITCGASGVQTTLHLTRDDLETLADVCATAIGGCVYLGSEDRDSEMTS